MQYRQLGRSGLKVSPLCLGTMNFGPHTAEADSFAIMDKALELGVQFFDTADVYGWKRGEGVTEQIIGRWLAARGPTTREQVVLATKVFGDMDLPDAPNPNLSRGLSARKIVMACDKSLQRLQTDWIDLYQMHHIDRACPWDELWHAFDTLMRQGKVRYVGSSNFAGWDIAHAMHEAKALHLPGLVSEQSPYNLATRTIELEVVPACRHFGVGIIPWSPLAGGLLGGALAKLKEGRRSGDKFEERVAGKREQLERYEALCSKVGAEPGVVALAWLLHNPVVTSPIIGPRTMDQLTSVIKAIDLKLDDDAMKELDAIWPGPGGEAPKAYAW
jgi:aryl-alcohol dehydrogenase-like predicted oxidoreductase